MPGVDRCSLRCDLPRFANQRIANGAVEDRRNNFCKFHGPLGQNRQIVIDN